MQLFDGRIELEAAEKEQVAAATAGAAPVAAGSNRVAGAVPGSATAGAAPSGAGSCTPSAGSGNLSAGSNGNSNSGTDTNRSSEGISDPDSSGSGGEGRGTTSSAARDSRQTAHHNRASTSGEDHNGLAPTSNTLAAPGTAAETPLPTTNDALADSLLQTCGTGDDSKTSTLSDEADAIRTATNDAATADSGKHSELETKLPLSTVLPPNGSRSRNGASSENSSKTGASDEAAAPLTRGKRRAHDSTSGDAEAAGERPPASKMPALDTDSGSGTGSGNGEPTTSGGEGGAKSGSKSRSPVSSTEETSDDSAVSGTSLSSFESEERDAVIRLHGDIFANVRTCSFNSRDSRAFSANFLAFFHTNYL